MLLRATRAVRYLYEDLRKLGKSQNSGAKDRSQDLVWVNTANKTVGIKSRRGDGAFGELVPVATAKVEQGFWLHEGRSAPLRLDLRRRFWQRR